MTDYLHRRLRNRFDLFYDRSKVSSERRARGLILGDPPTPTDQIDQSDVFLFALSDAAIKPGSRSLDELRYAQGLAPQYRPEIVFIAIEKSKVPFQYAGRIYGRLEWRSRRSDAKRIADEISVLLSRSLDAIDDLPSGPGSLDGGAIGQAMDVFASDSKRGVYLLDRLWCNLCKTHAVALITRRGKDQQTRVVRHLIEIFRRDRDVTRMERVRDNALILAAMLARNSAALAAEVAAEINHFRPDYSAALLFRGFPIARAIVGRADDLAEYTDGLMSNCGPAWNEQRRINREFHLAYYGGLAPALHRLRMSVRSQSPAALLPMNVFTLGTLSKEQSDVELLQEHAPSLRRYGVSRRVTEFALSHLRQSL